MKGRFMIKPHDLSKVSLYVQLIEELCELSQACSKKVRYIEHENPMPLNEEEIDSMIREEFTDAMLVAEILDLKIDDDIKAYKMNRWIQRLNP